MSHARTEGRVTPTIRAVATAAVIAVAAPAAKAVVVTTTDAQTNNTNTLPHTYIPSTTDLINGLTPSAQAGLFAEEGTGGVPALTNGTFASPISRAPTATETSPGDPFQFGVFATGGNTGGTSVTYTLPASAAGYNLTGITTYGGWQDGGRDQQLFTVSYATLAAPGTFIPIATVNFNPADPSANPQVTRVALTDTTGTLATNAGFVRFDFTATVENGYTGYAELDVFGAAAAVPEPASLGLLGVAATGLLARRRRA